MEISTRTAYRRQLTKIVKAATEYLNSEDAQLSNDNGAFDAVQEELETFIQRLKAVSGNLKNINDIILEKALIQQNIEDEIMKIAEYDDSAVTTLSRLECRLKQIMKKSQPSAIPTNNSSISVSNQHPSSHVKLPKLQLKKFDGCMRDWLPFWEQFKTSVHENPDLTSSEKFNYLESSLLSSAKKVISGFTASETCYDAAISLLKEQYGDTERLVDDQIQQLVMLRPVQSRLDVRSLRSLYNAITTCRRSLTALNVPSYNYDVMLKSILLRCLPSELRIDYHRTRGKDDIEPEARENIQGNENQSQNNPADSTKTSANGQVHNLMDFLKREIEALERSKVTPTQSTKTTNVSTAANLVALNEMGKERCIFCHSDSHLTKDCDSNLTLKDKRDVLVKNGRCFRCTKKGHSSKKCRSAKWVKCDKCKGNHITSLCDPTYKKTSVATLVGEIKDQKVDDNVALNLCANSSLSDVFLKTARCIGICQNNDNNLLLRVVIDGGSQNTYICETVVHKLKLKEIGKTNMTVMPFGASEKGPLKTFSKVRIVLKSQYDHQKVEIEAIVVPRICIDVLKAPDRNCSCFSKLKLADINNGLEMQFVDGLSMLIGSDYYWQIVTGKQQIITKQLRAVQTIFGWTLQGQHGVADVEENTSTLFVSNTDVSAKDLSTMWSLESIGIRGEEAEKSFWTEKLSQQCIRRSGNRYEASLPWKDDNLKVCNNRNSAIVRAKSLVQRLSRDPDKLKEYDAAVRKLLDDKIAEPVGESTSPRIFYLPHHPVFKAESETTKLRIVFDASFHTEDNPSLNSYLLTGTNLLADIQEILLNFRMGPFALVADIEKAFLQVKLNEGDRDSHRFIWLASLDGHEYKDYRMTRVTFGINCSPFLLSATIKFHLEQEEERYPETCKALKRSFYMDDLVLSVGTENEGRKVYEESMQIMSGASMSLRKWNSNSNKVRNLIQYTNFPASQKVLGLTWYAYSDELQVPLQSLQSLFQNSPVRGTKRNVLQAIARVYDPLGIISPTIIKLKILFQSIWKLKLAWDENLPGELLSEWEDSVKSLLELSDMVIPRSALPLLGPNKICIHIFADASLKAYGTVAYVKSLTSNGETNISFLCAKSRVAPLKENKDGELTLPKLELTAALIAARLCSYLKRSLKINVDNFFLWSDSKITLNWIYGECQRWKPYVQSRVNEIRNLTDVTQWNHCSGKENPADLLTRGIAGEKLKASSFWLQGPAWLKELQEETLNYQHSQDSHFTTQLLSVLDAPKVTQPIFNFKNYSSWEKILQVTGWIQRYLRIYRTKKRYDSKHLLAEEFDLAELYWIKYAQRCSFKDEIDALQQGKTIGKKSKISQLYPFLDEENVLRLGGRLQLLDDEMQVKHPIILPSECYITTLIIDDYHLKKLHAGVGIILSSLRQKFWIIRGRQLIKKRIKNCSVCKRLWGKPASQPFAPLPIERIKLTKPFDNVGVDFAGPLFYQKDANHNMHKAYIMIFTCAAVRAVHLELVSDMTTESCILAIRRFIARRGVPSTIFSDNAKTFRRASLELSESVSSIENEVIQGFLSKKRIRWKFIVERAQWWGGIWERLIRVIKNTLKAVIGKAKLDFDQLRTVITEAEAIANDRPLTYSSSDPLDLTPISPSNFLVSPSLSISSDFSSETHKDIQQLWKHRLKYTNKLWRRWRFEYLQMLRSFHMKDLKESISLKEGDIVLLFDNTLPRIHWKLSIVEKAYTGRDGKVRSCEIRCGDGKILRRPVQLLYPMELSSFGPAEDVKN